MHFNSNGAKATGGAAVYLKLATVSPGQCFATAAIVFGPTFVQPLQNVSNLVVKDDMILAVP